MLFLVTFEVDGSFHDAAAVQDARQSGGEFFGRIGQDPRVRASGHFADARGGFLLVELNSPGEMMELTGPFLDFVRFESHPVVPLGDLPQIFEQLGA